MWVWMNHFIALDEKRFLMELFAYRDDVDKYGKSWIELFLYCEAIYLNTQMDTCETVTISCGFQIRKFEL